MNLGLWLERTAAAAGYRPALISGTDVVADYATFHARAAALARSLRDRGVVPGDRIAIYARNCPEYLIAFYGIWISGGVVVPINSKLHAKEAAWILENSGARLCFGSSNVASELSTETSIPFVVFSESEFGELTHGVGMATEPREGNDLCWLFYTSGTTGRPKGVQITHQMVMAESLAYMLDVDPVEPEDAALYAAPMSHGAGLYLSIHVRMGAAHICPRSGGFDPDEVLQSAAAHGSASMFMAPTMVRRLLDTAQQCDTRGEGIKTIIYGGGPMYLTDIIEAVDWFGPLFVQIYGQGECPMAISALSRAEVSDRHHPRWRDRLGSVGRAQSIVEVSIGSADGTPLPHGETGEIMVRGAPVMPGYWKNETATAEALQDGWLKTGDVGVLDSDGYLTLVDRSKDLIISGGTNIYPREVEEVILEHPCVREVSVVGRPSKEWGEDVVAFVVSSSPIAKPEMDAFCLDHISRFKRPKDYVFVDELPKNNYGKVLKTELRTRFNTDA